MTFSATTRTAPTPSIPSMRTPRPKSRKSRWFCGPTWWTTADSWPSPFVLTAFSVHGTPTWCPCWWTRRGAAKWSSSSETGTTWWIGLMWRTWRTDWSSPRNVWPRTPPSAVRPSTSQMTSRFCSGSLWVVSWRVSDIAHPKPAYRGRSFTFWHCCWRLWPSWWVRWSGGSRPSRRCGWRSFLRTIRIPVKRPKRCWDISRCSRWTRASSWLWSLSRNCRIQMLLRSIDWLIDWPTLKLDRLLLRDFFLLLPVRYHFLTYFEQGKRPESKLINVTVSNHRSEETTARPIFCQHKGMCDRLIDWLICENLPQHSSQTFFIVLLTLISHLLLIEEERLDKSGRN